MLNFKTIMKKILTPIISKAGILFTGIAILVLASCAHKQTAMSSHSNGGDIVWYRPSATTIEISNEVAATQEDSKKDFQEIIASQIVASKADSKLTFKEQIASKVIANKINKAYQKLSPAQKTSLKADMNASRGNDGLKKAVLVMLVGLGIAIIGSALWINALGLLFNLVIVIGILVFLYGVWLSLDELIF
jgi:hypothetical protein